MSGYGYRGGDAPVTAEHVVIPPHVLPPEARRRALPAVTAGAPVVLPGAAHAEETGARSVTPGKLISAPARPMSLLKRPRDVAASQTVAALPQQVVGAKRSKYDSVAGVGAAAASPDNLPGRPVKGPEQKSTYPDDEEVAISDEAEYSATEQDLTGLKNYYSEENPLISPQHLECMLFDDSDGSASADDEHEVRVGQTVPPPPASSVGKSPRPRKTAQVRRRAPIDNMVWSMTPPSELASGVREAGEWLFAAEDSEASEPEAFVVKEVEQLCSRLQLL